MKFKVSLSGTSFRKVFFTRWCLDDVITACMDYSSALRLPSAVGYTAVHHQPATRIHRFRKKSLFYLVRKRIFYLEILMYYLGLYKSVAPHEIQVRSANRSPWVG